jgi:hypothetical protein
MSIKYHVSTICKLNTCELNGSKGSNNNLKFALGRLVISFLLKLFPTKKIISMAGIKAQVSQDLY